VSGPTAADAAATGIVDTRHRPQTHANRVRYGWRAANRVLPDYTLFVSPARAFALRPVHVRAVDGYLRARAAA
jgi:hypothetical protein